MDEGTIYNPQGGQNNPVQNPAVVQPIPASPQPAMPQPPLPQATEPMTPIPTPSVPPTAPPPAKSSFSKKAIKIILGIFVVLFLLVIVLVIVSKLSGQKKSQSGPVTITYWGLVEENKVDTQIKGFESENPGVKVNYVKEDPSDYVEKLKVRIPNGNGPDVYMLNNSWVTALSSYLLPLPQDVMDQSKFSESYYDVVKEDLVKNGAVYAIPLNMDTLGLFINPTLLPSGQEDNSPGTWQEFVGLAQSATKRDDQGKIIVAGAGIGTFDNVKQAQYLLALLFAQNGVDFTKVDDYQDRISQALTFYTDFAQVENSVWDDAQDNSLLSFTQGKSAMYFGFASDVETIKSQKPDLSFRIEPIPQLTPEDPKNIANFLAQGVSFGTAHQKEALSFVKYILQHPTNIGLLPASKNSSSSLDANLSFFKSQAASAVSSPYGTDPSEKSLSAKLVKSLRDSVNSIVGGGSADEIAGQLIIDYTSAISSLQNTSTSK